MAGGIEDRILSNIEENTEPFDLDNQNADGLDEQDNLESQVNRQSQPTNQDADSGDLSDPFNKNQQQPRKVADPKKGEEQRKTRSDANGNLVDERGNIIARSGEARRLHSQVERLRATNNTLESRTVELARQLEQVNFLNNLPKQYGLANEEVADGLQILASFKADPAKAARMVIERALAAGVSLHQIVNDDFIPNVTLDATRRLLDERLGPIAKERQEGQDVEAVRQQGIEAATRFLTDYPDAEINNEAVAIRMKSLREEYRDRGIDNVDPYLLAERAWNDIVRFAEKNNLDPTQPLGPQIRARAQQTQTPTNGRKTNAQRGTQGQPVRQSRPMPNGSNGGGEIVERKSRSNSADDSFDSIVRDAMAENGLSFDR